MTITLHTSRGDLTGDSVPTIIATEWGPEAFLSLLGDGARLGQVMERDEHQASVWRILGTVTSARTADGELHYNGGDWLAPYLDDPLAGVRAATGQLVDTRALLAGYEEVWREAIRAAVDGGQRVVDIAAAAGVDRQRIYQIRGGR